ncbi:hypothetical protein VHEMI01274 [[Torrubiella] hemipterigena]|uniref:AT hook domain-containing protein n=1 Tax=[Torrubiella] hemipterigena TaxID=1531966 RepID=A0A0A1T749_9HYPO|nr:hypothetical protein VHEMI01274 [[Torrubiella] hemipterigena]
MDSVQAAAAAAEANIAAGLVDEPAATPRKRGRPSTGGVKKAYVPTGKPRGRPKSDNPKTYVPTGKPRGRPKGSTKRSVLEPVAMTEGIIAGPRRGRPARKLAEERIAADAAANLPKSRGRPKKKAAADEAEAAKKDEEEEEKPVDDAVDVVFGDADADADVNAFDDDKGDQSGWMSAGLKKIFS